MVTTLTSSGAVLAKAGANVSSVISLDPNEYIDTWINQAEGIINVATKKDWVDAYATALPAGTKLILDDAASNLAAIYAITYDMSGYTSRGEAESTINVLRDGFLRDISILKDIKGEFLE